MRGAPRPDTERALNGLKDFQRATVEHVFRRMYLDDPCQHRFLVADEVGLGKTLVARGLIAKVVDRLWDSVERIDVIYICSNTDIARQNINRLRLPGSAEFTLASRITMLPVQVQDLKSSHLNFVSLTPGTSFDPKSKLGQWHERALLYLLLRDSWDFKGTGALNLFQGNKSSDRFRAAVKEFEANRPIDQDLADRFRQNVMEEPTLKDLCLNLVQRFGYRRTHIPAEDAQDRRRLIGALRGCLAATCIEALEPDLIILDEFQRFKDLLDGDVYGSTLARNLFDWSRGNERARVLLLSATPYKMYTLASEHDADDHYADFRRTIRFLTVDGSDADLDSLLRRYRNDLYQLGEGESSGLTRSKAELEHTLRRVMVRTERLAVTTDRDGMLRDGKIGDLELEAGDVDTYRSLYAVADSVGQTDPVEFWKSAPYLLSFMEDYQLKSQLEERLAHPPSAAAIADILRSATGLSISRDDIERYADCDPRNARLRWLLGETVARGAWRALWIPAALPYYMPEGIWADPSLEGLTKRLVFSSWRVVPRMVAAMVSYAAERAAVEKLVDTRLTWSNLRERLRGPLRFNLRDGQPAGMTGLALIYPSLGIGTLADPLRWAAGGCRNLADIRAEARVAIETALKSIAEPAKSGGDDDRWYWAAPILIDLYQDEEAVQTFFAHETLAALWAGEESEEEDVGWAKHLDLARQLVAGRLELGRRPADLVDALTDLALGAPGVVATRALGRVAASATLADRVTQRREGARIGWVLRNLFNLPESVALLRGIDSSEPYWRRVAEYCVAGNLQSVLDEYAHVLLESEGLVGRSPRVIMTEMGEQLRAAISLRTSTPGFDEVVANGQSVKITPSRLRARFALRFGEERSEGDEKHAMRAGQVREAFNSPFWPFVLATTSVGQEGLDFHPYCHAVVHWNLPSNPVDLEQREGRVHRYKGHAIRKTVADRHRPAAADSDLTDPWAALFASAASTVVADSELAPYWVHGDPDGHRIERQVPVLPLSRDVLRFERLRRSLALYRMVFGQPRQDDLVAYLIDRMPAERVREQLDQYGIDLQPPPFQVKLPQPQPVVERRVVISASGEIGRDLLFALDRYPLLSGEPGAGDGHPVAQALYQVAGRLSQLDLFNDWDRTSWELSYKERGRWSEVPLAWLSDERPRTRKGDDLTIELMLDLARDGVHLALVSDWTRWGDKVGLQAAARYREARRIQLGGFLDELALQRFAPVPAGQFLRVVDAQTVSGVTLLARFYPRDELTDDAPLIEGLRRLATTYDETLAARLGGPGKAERSLLR